MTGVRFISSFLFIFFSSSDLILFPMNVPTPSMRDYDYPWILKDFGREWARDALAAAFVYGK